MSANLSKIYNLWVYIFKTFETGLFFKDQHSIPYSETTMEAKTEVYTENETKYKVVKEPDIKRDLRYL